MKWSLSEFINFTELRGQTWCVAELSSSAGFSISSNEVLFFYAPLQGSIRIAGVAEGPTCLGEGDALLILSGEAHAVRMQPDSPTRTLEFLREGNHCDSPVVVTVGDGPVAARVLCGRLKLRWPGGIMADALPASVMLKAGDTPIGLGDLVKATSGAGASGVLTRIVSLMLAFALQRHSQRSEFFPEAATSDPIARAVQIIDRLPAQPWTVTMLAQKVGMGRSNFAARFAAATGRTPMEMLAGRRMQQAADMLDEGALKISEIAVRVGYQSEAAFIRRFVGQFGVTPGKMRASLRRGDMVAAARP